MDTSNMHPNTTAYALKTSVEAFTVMTPRTGPNSGYAEIHAAGCAHLNKRNQYGEPEPFSGRTLADDWYEVAPCARANSKRQTPASILGGW